MQRKSRMLVLCSFFTALMAVFAQIQIPLAYVPINLALFAVHMAGVLLGPLYGSISVGIYLLLAAVGVPVLTGFRGGLSALIGAAGGYTVGYLFTVIIVGIGCRYWGVCFWKLCIYMTVGVLACYTLGTMWFMIISGDPLRLSLVYCVWPFLPGDVIKIIMAAWVSLRLRRFS
jgi:biotin transport system substrate-specific component